MKEKKVDTEKKETDRETEIGTERETGKVEREKTEEEDSKPLPRY